MINRPLFYILIKYIRLKNAIKRGLLDRLIKLKSKPNKQLDVQLCENRLSTDNYGHVVLLPHLISWWSMISAFNTIRSKKTNIACCAPSFLAVRVEWVGVVALRGGTILWGQRKQLWSSNKFELSTDRLVLSQRWTRHCEIGSCYKFWYFFRSKCGRKSNAKCNEIFVTRYIEM